MCATHILIMLHLSVKFHPICLVVYEQHNFRHNLTFDLIVTLTLGIGTYLLGATHLLIMFYLSVRFR